MSKRSRIASIVAGAIVWLATWGLFFGSLYALWTM
jgi:Na+/proline symporter